MANKTYLDKSGLTYFWGKIKSFVNNKTTPVGTISMFGGITAPSGWLLCDGSEISRTDYADLFNVIGTTYGTGDGSTTFNLPDFRDRTPFGYDSTQTPFNTLGKTGGSVDMQVDMNMFLSSGRLYIDYLNDSGSQYYETDRKWVPNCTSESGRHEASTATIHIQGKTDSSNCLPPYIAIPFMIKY